MSIKKTRNVIVIGCGRLGASLAASLSGDRFCVTILDCDEDAFLKLPRDFGGYVLVADATDVDVLIKAGIADAEMVIIATHSDNANCLIAQIASRLYSVPKVYLRLNDTEKETLVEDYNVEVIYPFKLTLDEFERLSAVDLSEVSL